MAGRGTADGGTVKGRGVLGVKADRPGLKQLYERGIHEPVFVGDVQADNLLVGQRCRKSGRQFRFVFPLHYHDYGGPTQQFGRERRVGVGTHAGRGALEPGVGGGYFFGRWAAPPVPATDEQDAPQRPALFDFVIRQETANRSRKASALMLASRTSTTGWGR